MCCFWTNEEGNTKVCSQLYVCVLETGAVFTFGKSQFADNIPNKFWIRDDKVIQVCCGDEHTALVAGKIMPFILLYALLIFL